ncbi:hypothetical protein K440DRAFT_67861 [Wilcoxina mikolae CBS 423.85]|nr:hypothetical protein K440DRAFT_67861 [Wilcoxina mikolae CBS 423.85]
MAGDPKACNCSRFFFCALGCCKVFSCHGIIPAIWIRRIVSLGAEGGVGDAATASEHPLDLDLERCYYVANDSQVAQRGTVSFILAYLSSFHLSCTSMLIVRWWGKSMHSCGWWGKYFPLAVSH